MAHLTRRRRPGRPSILAVLRVLFVFSPVLVPVLFVLVFVVMFFVLMVVQAFGQGFAAGCASLAALIGLPSLGLLWLSAAIRIFGPEPIVSNRPTPRASPSTAAIEARRLSGDSIHRVYDAEERFRREADLLRPGGSIRSRRAPARTGRRPTGWWS